jgi:uncharacterized membrane protein YkoI
MKAWTKILGGVGAALTLTSGVAIWAASSADALRGAPPAVQLAVVQLVGTNKVNEFDSEVEAGKTVYDLEYIVKGVTYEADIDPSGQILTREVEVDLSIVPPAVVSAAKKSHADGTIGETAIVTAGDKMFYEMDVKVGKDTHEVQISAGGSVLADTIEAPEAPETPAAGAKPAAKGGNTEEKD